MKCLGGMHSKFRQTSSECLEEFATEWPSPNNLLHYAASADDENLSELFCKFQAMRALEKSPLIRDTAKPKFVTYGEMMKNMEAKTTEDELKLVKESLEKVLFTCARKSRHSGKILQEAANNSLQHDVIGSQVGVPKTTIVLKEHRTSLLELFQKTKTTEEKSEPKSNIENQKIKKTAYTSSVRLVKNKLKRRTLHPSSKRSVSASVGTIDSTSADEKLQKILRMLHRVYPKSSAISQKSQNLWKYVTNSNFVDEEGYANRNILLSEDIIVFPYSSISEISANNVKSKVSHSVYGGGDTNLKKECWIKSDADYLILEL